MERGKREKQALTGAAELFDLPVDVVAGLPHVEVLGNRQLYMENHRGIVAYSSEEIAISGGGILLRVRGRDLVLVSMTGGALRIQGTLQSVEWVV